MVKEKSPERYGESSRKQQVEVYTNHLTAGVNIPVQRLSLMQKYA